MRFYIVLALCVFFIISCSQPDLQRSDKNFHYVLDAAGVSTQEIISRYDLIFNISSDPFARGDQYLILGRIKNDNSIICQGVPYYKAALGKNPEQDAIIYETLSSLDCGEDKSIYLKEASYLWKDVGSSYRSKVDISLANGDELDYLFETSSPIPSLEVPQGTKSIVFGNTSFLIPNESVIMTQVDRVYRDWLGGQMNQSPFDGGLLLTFSERFSYDEDELRSDIGWHEGGRLSFLNKYGIKPKTAVGTLAARNKEGRWFAANENGTFMFEVPLDKILYPTTRFLREDLAVLVDTHGTNMLVEQTLRSNYSFVLSDCDHPGKVKAALYLSEMGVHVACFPDRFVFLALGHGASLVGSPPIRSTLDGVVVGGQPVLVSVDEPIVVMDANITRYAIWYYQTPKQYFSNLSSFIDLNIHYISIDNFDEMEKVVEKARGIDSHVVAVRVFRKSDYEAVRNWLLENKINRAILFHSTSYPYGFLLSQEFSARVGFDDPNTIFKKSEK